MNFNSLWKVCCRSDSKERRSASSKSKSKSAKEGSRGDSKERDKKDTKGDDKAEDEAFDPTNLDKVRFPCIILHHSYKGECEKIQS
jgi:hypothetical protein